MGWRRSCVCAILSCKHENHHVFYLAQQHGVRNDSIMSVALLGQSLFEGEDAQP